MTLRFSTGLRNNLAGNKGFASTFNRGSIQIYSGTQPVTADAAVTGTLLGTVTIGSGALTQEVRASATITVSGAAGAINAVTVGGLSIIPDVATVNFNTSTTQTASDLCDAINRNALFEATFAAAVVTVLAPRGSGVAYNAIALATTATTLTATSSGNLAGGVAGVNGLTLGIPSGGAVSKTGVWSFNGAAAGVAGWFRFVASSNDPGALVSAAPYYIRLDGSIATSGADMNLSNISIALNAPNTIDTFTYTQPAQ